MSAAGTPVENTVFVWRGSGISAGISGATGGNQVNPTGYERLDSPSPDNDTFFGQEYRFYWNRKENWFERVVTTDQSDGVSLSNRYTFISLTEVYDNVLGVSIDPGASGEFLTSNYYEYKPATRVPTGGDIVIFEKLEGTDQEGLSGGPYPLTPCLFGGFDRMNGTNQWHNASGSTGATGQAGSNLKRLEIKESYSRKSGYGPSGGSYESEYIGYDLGSLRTDFYWDGPLWSGIEVIADEIILGANHRRTQFSGVDCKTIDHIGSASSNLSGTAEYYIFRTDDIPYLSDEWYYASLYEDYQFTRVHNFSGNVTERYEFVPKRSSTTYINHEICKNGETLSNFVSEPGTLDRSIDASFPNLVCDDVILSPFDIIGDVNFIARGSRPNFHGVSETGTIIDTMLIKSQNNRYPNNTNPRYVATGKTTIKNLEVNAGEFGVQYNETLSAQQGLQLDNVIINGGNLTLNSGRAGAFSINLGPSGSTSAFVGALSYSKDNYVSFDSGFLFKTFAGEAEDSGGGTGGGVGNVFTYSSKSTRNLLDKFYGLDLISPGGESGSTGTTGGTGGIGYNG